MVDHKIKTREIRDIDMSLVEVSSDNVRTEEQLKNIDELVTSIQRVGLIHPILVIEKENGTFEIIVGQRRYLAFKILKQKTIPAIVINDLDPITRKIVSFTENIHRKDLPYSDTIKICDELFNNYPGTEKERIEKISKEIGVSIETVSKYLSYRLVPQRVQTMVADGKISADQAYKITSAFWPNTEKIQMIAEYTAKVPRPIWERALTIGKKNKQASVEDIIAEASVPSDKYKISLQLDPDIIKILSEEADKRSAISKKKISLQDLILEIIDKFVHQG